ncbi:hypothetical protein [Parabacteroides merdae]|uniref:hypothetical protein n=1 Tax=Parabacteroides merdae TaxID=46503 RepID=UPI0034A44587
MENEELTREEIENIENIEKFKAIKYFRLFCPTINQFHEKYKLQALDTNSHGKYEDEIKNALNDLRETCRCQTEGIIQLDTLLEQLNASYEFYNLYIKNSKSLTVNENRWLFLELLLTENDKAASDNKKILSLYNRYKNRIDNGEPVDPSIIMLMTLELITKSNSKQTIEPTNLESDFKTMLNEFYDYIVYMIDKDSSKHYIPSLSDIKSYIQELYNQDEYPENRLELIAATQIRYNQIRKALYKDYYYKCITNSISLSKDFPNGFWKVKDKPNEYIEFKQDGLFILKTPYILIPSAPCNRLYKIETETEIIAFDNKENGILSYQGLSLKDYTIFFQNCAIDSLPLNEVADFSQFSKSFTISINYDANGEAESMVLTDHNKGEITLVKADIELNSLECTSEIDMEYILKPIFNLVKQFKLKRYKKIKTYICDDSLIFSLKDDVYQLILSKDALTDFPWISKPTINDGFYEIQIDGENNETINAIISLAHRKFIYIDNELLKKNYFKRITADNVLSLFSNKKEQLSSD